MLRDFYQILANVDQWIFVCTFIIVQSVRHHSFCLKFSSFFIWLAEGFLYLIAYDEFIIKTLFFPFNSLNDAEIRQLLMESDSEDNTIESLWQLSRQMRNQRQLLIVILTNQTMRWHAIRIIYNAEKENRPKFLHFLIFTIFLRRYIQRILLKLGSMVHLYHINEYKKFHTYRLEPIGNNFRARWTKIGKSSKIFTFTNFSGL